MDVIISEVKGKPQQKDSKFIAIALSTIIADWSFLVLSLGVDFFFCTIYEVEWKGKTETNINRVGR